MSTQDEHETLVTDCENRESKLTDWERGLVASCREWLDAGRALTKPMAASLDEVWERVT